MGEAKKRGAAAVPEALTVLGVEALGGPCRCAGTSVKRPPRSVLSVLAGHWRYAHITALRADAVSAGLLGMDGIVCRGHGAPGAEGAR